MKRFEDEGAYKYSFYSVLRRGERVDVKCPKCGGHASIEQRNDQMGWKCSECYAQASEEPVYQYKAKGNCAVCERWFNVEVTDEKKTSHRSTHVECPHCSSINQVELHAKPTYQRYFSEIFAGKDPVFGMELYFLDNFRGKIIWAVNREHLNYLIAYVSADLRVKYGNMPIRTASHSIPAYIKDAKNRDVVVRTLSKLQHKTG
ncbi:hypothetical protein OM416_04135 [Paenibacillus sp. LS1]|uniref:hypothetical protein n=1 Tax=Paenibacillus sp. LS1 TaxID=2992120 RepID=UPI00222EF168|nr:hypothetical protein [Paenibacillus sp. LS1]MCW3790757.1 hypothetical protein [Paenibacillus sp. LS1]